MPTRERDMLRAKHMFRNYPLGNGPRLRHGRSPAID